MTRLLLVRHAQSDPAWESERRLCGWYDPPLGAEGIESARRLAVSLRTETRNFGGPLYTSPLRRACQTAEILARALDVALQSIPDLREINCGIHDGMLLADARCRFPELWQRNQAQDDEDFCWPGGETYRDFRHRVRTAVLSLTARHPGSDIVAVTHTGVITQILGMLHGWSPARWDTGRPDPATITIVEWTG